MTRCACGVVAMLVLPLSGAAADDQLHNHHRTDATNAHIRLTINPEARVSVMLAGSLPPPLPCGTAVDLQVSILNAGFVTAHLEAHWVGPAPPGVTFHFAEQPLTGASEELRTLRVTLTRPGSTDLTVAFRAARDMPDLGGRDRVHFLMSCESQEALGPR